MMKLLTLLAVFVAVASAGFTPQFNEFRSLLDASAPLEPPTDDISCPIPLVCPVGYTGPYCDIQLCDRKGLVVLPHPDRGYVIDYQSYKQCNVMTLLPIDTHVSTVFLFLDGAKAGANPRIRLQDNAGKDVPVYNVFQNDSKTLGIQYELKGKPGRYYVTLSASTACAYQSHGVSDLVIPVGFVSGKRATHNDDPHKFIYSGDVSYAVAHAAKLPKPGKVKHIEIFADGELLQGYEPKIRFRCAYELYFGPLICNVNSLYYYKLYGIDENGVEFLRTDLIHCKGGHFTTTPGPSTTPAGPCLNDGHYVNGKCVCTPYWKGDKCQDIVCMNGGTVAPDNECICSKHFGGRHCAAPVCTTQHVIPIWGPHYRSFSLVLQNTKSNRHNVEAVKQYITAVIQDFIQHHENFITQYTLHLYDDKNVETVITTSDPYSFMEFVHHIDDNNKADGNCQKKTVLALIHALANAQPYGSVYVITDSPDTNDAAEVLSAQHLIGQYKATVNFFVIKPNCGQIKDPGYAVYDKLALISGGEVYKPEDQWNSIYQLLETIHLMYEDVFIAENKIEDCSKPRTITIPIDSDTAAFTVTVRGANPTVKLYSPKDSSETRTETLVRDPAVVQAQVITPCPRYWDQREHNCYFAQVKPLSWKDAQNWCRDHGAVLVSVLNYDRQVFLDQEVGGKTDYWIGLNDIEIEGHYEWDSDSYKLPLGHYYTNWGPNEPNDETHSKNCVAVQYKGDDHGALPKWYNRACTDKLPFICERHAFDSDNKAQLKPGVYLANVTTDGGSCSYSVRAQSGIQAYYGFSTDLFNDYPGIEPISGVNNYVVVNISNLAPRHNIPDHYGHYPKFTKTELYSTDFKKLRDVEMYRRINCSYQYVSDAFKCPADLFGVVMYGLDSNGWPWQRIRTAECLSPKEAVQVQQHVAELKSKYMVPVSGKVLPPSHV